MNKNFHKTTEKMWGIISLVIAPILSDEFCSPFPDPAQGFSNISVSKVCCLGKRFDNKSFVIWITLVGIARKKWSSDWPLGSDGKTKQMHDYELSIYSEMNRHVCAPWTAKLCSEAMSLLKQILQAITHLSWGMHPMCVCMCAWFNFSGLGAGLEVSNWMRLFKPKTLIWAVWDVGSQLLWTPLHCWNAVNIFTV